MKLNDYRVLTLAALLRSETLRDMYASQIKIDMFEDTKHRFLAHHIKSAKTFTDVIESSDKIGGIAYINSITRLLKRFGQVTPREVTKWIKFLDNAAKRQTVENLIDQTREELDKLAFESNTDKLIESLVSNLVTSSTETRTAKGFRTLDEAADDVIADIFDLSRGIVRDRTPTGFPELDEFLDGGLPHGLIVIAGAPGVGKTTLVLDFLVNKSESIRRQIVKSRGRQSPGVVCMVSAEMTLSRLYKRIAQSRAGVEVRKNMPLKDAKKAATFVAHARSLPLLVDDSDVLNTKIIFQRLETIFLRYGKIAELGIDFAERILDDENESMEQKVGQVFIRAAILGKRYDCPVNMISHLNRDSEKSNSKVPSMSDLRYSRLAEATAELIGLPYYPYQYVKTGKAIKTPSTMPAIPGTSYLIIDKHRDGPTGVKPMAWIENITRWEDSPRSGIYHRVSSSEVLNYME